MYESIINYINYLKQECGLSVTLHPTENENVIYPSDLILFNIHENPYCLLVKTSQEAQDHCIECQAKVAGRAKQGSYSGGCYAGVREYVYPIRSGDRDAGSITGFISVSGYRTEEHLSYVKRMASKYMFSLPELESAYSSLRTAPAKEYVDTLVEPLIQMLELAYIRTDDEITVEETLISRILRYVRRNYHRDITLDELCEEFYCTKSHICHIFKAETGTTLFNYLNGLKVESAKKLLSNSGLNITQISQTLGFKSSSYFGKVFKELTGMSPLKYVHTARCNASLW